MTTASYQLEQQSHTMEYETGHTPQQDFLLLMPYDLIATIFSLLPTPELVTCTVVCQRWRSFVMDNPHILWRQLLLGSTMQFFKCPAFAGGPADWKAKHIRSFSMDHSRVRVPYASIRESDMAAMFKRLIDTGCRYLEHMEFYDCPLSIVEFLQYAQFCGVNLRSLDISNSYIDPRIVSIILSTCPNLISIDCHDCTPYVSSVLSMYPAAIEIPVCQLVSMQIVVDETTGPGYLARLLRSCPNLRSLTLNSQVDWIVRDVIDRPPPEIIFDAIYDVVQQTCTKLESFTFSCLPYWTISEHAFITETSPASLQDLALQTATNSDDTLKCDVARDNVVKRCYATLEYYIGCPPPRMKNATWTMLSISVDTDIARVGYRYFPFTLGSVHRFLTDRPFLTTVELSGVSHKYNYKPSGRLIPAVTGLPLLSHLVLTNSDMQTVASILGKHTCRTLKKLTVKNALWMGDRCWLEDLSKVVTLRVLTIDNCPQFDQMELGLLSRQNTCMLEEIRLVRLELQHIIKPTRNQFSSTCPPKHWILGLSSLRGLKRVRLVQCRGIMQEDIMEIVDRTKGLVELQIVGCEIIGNINKAKSLFEERGGKLMML